MSAARPFLKWAGGKTKLVSAIATTVPVTARRLVEPFVGSGAVALNLSLPENLLADTNADLVAAYTRLRDAPEEFIAECAGLFTPEANSPAVYYQRREEFNALADPARRAALFIYLNRHGYNGLCRYNARGGFNVPFGRYRAPYFPRDEMRAFHSLLRRSTLVHADFRDVLAQAGPGDFVYCDPPYVPASPTANFTAYARSAFGPAEQEALAACCAAARQRGAVVALSNHDTPQTRALYAADDECHELLVRRQISCQGANRTKARELLVVYRPAA
ncbi:MAG: Dam family site-specific DNA-(adenine-N6)-methyltransferase [Opitutaceae bacterium]|nr:Dam family site-specific DNA-(adenine-N6)-methyltransferase [Opitutaceae bacterium]